MKPGSRALNVAADAKTTERSAASVVCAFQTAAQVPSVRPDGTYYLSHPLLVALNYLSETQQLSEEEMLLVVCPYG